MSDKGSGGGTNPGAAPEQRGILCNDQTGLCLAWSGAVDSTDASNAGIYTNLTRLASKLSQNNDDAAPLITLETESAAWLVKEYDGGHAVALKVPSQTTEGEAPLESQIEGSIANGTASS